jgi:hypothetical protein
MRFISTILWVASEGQTLSLLTGMIEKDDRFVCIWRGFIGDLSYPLLSASAC